MSEEQKDKQLTEQEQDQKQEQAQEHAQEQQEQQEQQDQQQEQEKKQQQDQVQQQESTKVEEPAQKQSADMKPEAKADTEQEAKPETKPEAKTDTKQEAKDAGAALSDEEKEAKKAAREARLAKARAAKKAEAKDGEAKAEADEEEAPKEPSPNQPLLDKIVKLIQEEVGAEAIEESMINEADGHLPVVVVKSDFWFKTAALVKIHEALQLNYLINLSGVDRETHLEVVYHIESFETNEQYCFKVRTDRDAASIPSVTPVWNTANWPEREVYDLLGIDFPGHPDLRRIMMSDDWVGHPLRKDYEPLDPEV